MNILDSHQEFWIVLLGQQKRLLQRRQRFRAFKGHMLRLSSRGRFAGCDYSSRWHLHDEHKHATQ